MPLFVDHVGLNTLISEELSTDAGSTLDTNTRAATLSRSYETQEDRSIYIGDYLVSWVGLINENVTGYPTVGEITFSFWIKPKSLNTSDYRVIYSGHSSGGINTFLIFLKDNNMYFTALDPSLRYKTWDITFPINTYNESWAHVYINWSGDFAVAPTRTINGGPSNSMTYFGGTAAGLSFLQTSKFMIGNQYYPSSYELKGQLQNFSLYSGTPPSAATLYNSGSPQDIVESTNLLEHWKLGNEPQFWTTSTGAAISTGVVIKSSGGSVGSDLTVNVNSLSLQEGKTTDNTPTLNLLLENGFVGRVLEEKQLAALNTHRNGPYGYSSWKQLRVSENPITRYHNANSTLTFVTQPGPIRNIALIGDFKVRDRYSSIYTFREPAVAQKTYPLIWNVGRHFKDEDGNLAPEPQKFSIVSSYANNMVGFANDKVNSLLKFTPDDEQSEYVAISQMYLENGLNKQDSPLTYWEFLQYRETVYPHMMNQFQNENLQRPTYESFYRHNREDRTKLIYTSSFGFTLRHLDVLSQSTWPLDEHQYFLSRSYLTEQGSIEFDAYGEPSYPEDRASYQRNGEGILMATIYQYESEMQQWTGTSPGQINNSDPVQIRIGINAIDNILSPGPLYMRRISLRSTASVSNPSGMEIYGTSSTGYETLFQGGALWEAGSKRYIKDEDGNYVHSPKQPFYDTYEHYIEEARRYAKNYSVVPEFRMSTQVEDYKNNNIAIEKDMFEVVGGVSGSENSSKDDFYTIYSNSDFMRQFEVINEDHKDFTNAKVISLRCKAVKKFLPYEGFYPAQRTVDLAKRFYDSFGNNIKLVNENNVELDGFNFGKQMVMAPLFAPGILFNTIKSGVAVDYPIITGSLDQTPFGGEHYIYNNNFDYRVPFEALVEPQLHLANKNLVSNEPHPSGNLSASANWDGQGDELYTMMANNFLAAVPEFFLPNGQFTSVVSKKQEDIVLNSGSIYGMRIKMRRSLEGTKQSVYHSGSSYIKYYPPQDVANAKSNFRESFTMYSRPSAFGPPSMGFSAKLATLTELNEPTAEFFGFNIPNRFEQDVTTVGSQTVYHIAGSKFGYNFPFTPPYYHGEAWCDVILTASSDRMTISEIQEACEYSYTRFDNTFFNVTSSSGSIDYSQFGAAGPQSWAENKINENAVQLSASLNIKGIGTIRSKSDGAAQGSLVVDSAVGKDSRWVIQTKFETPMLNFAHVSGSEHLTLPEYGSGSVPRGMWHQHGRIPEENEGVFLEVGPIEAGWWVQARGETNQLRDLSQALGFSGASTKLGRLASSKTISEAVVAVPFIEENGTKRFFRLPLSAEHLSYYKEGNREALTTGAPQSQIGRSVLLQMDKMQKFIFPPSFDFLNFPDVEPIAMYVFEFSHTLSQQDLSDIWQNLPPDIGSQMEVSEVAITHPLLQKELLGQGGEEGNQKIDMPERLKWMVFKVKQRAASNYFKKTVLRNPEVNTDIPDSNVTKDEFGDITPIQYNWPYDFFSLVELVKIDAEVELGNLDLSNYTDNIPEWNAVQADPEKVGWVVGGLEDIPVSEPSFNINLDAVDIAQSFLRNREIEGRGLESLVETSQMAAKVQQQNFKAGLIQSGGELSSIRDMSRQGNTGFGMGVDFSSFNNFISSIPSNVVLQAGIPMDEFENIANSAFNLVNQYNVAVQQYGVNSQQAQQLSTQLNIAVQPLQGTGLMNNLMSALNFNFTGLR